MKNLCLAAILFSALFISCQKGTIYDHSERIPSSGWSQYESLCFYDSLPDNAPESFKIRLNLRHNPNYPYKNLRLYVRTTLPNNVIRLDTVDWKLCNNEGKWLGSGWGSLYSLEYNLPDLKIKKHGKFRWVRFDISQAMKDNNLRGIEDIGVRLGSE